MARRGRIPCTSPVWWLSASLLLLFTWVLLRLAAPEYFSPWEMRTTSETYHSWASLLPQPRSHKEKKAARVALQGEKQPVLTMAPPPTLLAKAIRRPGEKQPVQTIASPPTLLVKSTRRPGTVPTASAQAVQVPKAPMRPHVEVMGAKPLMVAMAARMAQLEDVIVVINSAVAHANQPNRLIFRVVTVAADVDAFVKELQSRLSYTVDLKAVAFDAWMPRVSRLVGGKSSLRKELFDELNFAAFYLHEVFPAPPGNRVLYLDTDVVVLSDISRELAERDLQGLPLAAARDCSQHIRKYIDFEKLKKQGIRDKLPRLKLQPSACVVNRGVVLVDTVRWREEDITGAIETLVEDHLTKGVGPFWRAGVSQPPFLLAVTQKYHNLGTEYNIRGLGRGDIGPEEVDYYRRHNVWAPYLDLFIRKCRFHCCPGCKGWSLTPYVSPIAHTAKILHFNGRFKPKKAGRRGVEPLAVPPKDLDNKALEEREQRPLCSCGSRCVQECAGIWWKYLPPHK